MPLTVDKAFEHPLGCDAGQPAAGSPQSYFRRRYIEVMANYLLRAIKWVDIDAETGGPLDDDGQMGIPPEHE